jgi:hypothetical protein
MSQGTVATYPYIMGPLDGGKSFVVDRLPPDQDGNQRLVAYELGPIDWKVTVLLNPVVIERLLPLVEKFMEKLGKTPPEGNGGKNP